TTRGLGAYRRSRSQIFDSPASRRDPGRARRSSRMERRGRTRSEILGGGATARGRGRDGKAADAGDHAFSGAPLSASRQTARALRNGAGRRRALRRPLQKRRSLVGHLARISRAAGPDRRGGATRQAGSRRALLLQLRIPRVGELEQPSRRQVAKSKGTGTKRDAQQDQLVQPLGGPSRLVKLRASEQGFGG